MSNSFLALAIGAYFVLPLLFVFNAYMVNCLGIRCCYNGLLRAYYPYAQFVSSGFTLPDMSSSTSRTRTLTTTPTIPSQAASWA